MKAVTLSSIAVLALAVALFVVLRRPGGSDEAAQASHAESDTGVAVPLETCKNLEGIQQTRYVANCDVTFVGFTVPVVISATLFATDHGKTLSLDEPGELSVCAELSLSKDILQAVDAAHAEPEVKKGVFVVSISNANLELIPQAVPPQPIGEAPVRTEVLQTFVQPQEPGTLEVAARGASIDIRVAFKGGVDKALPLEIPSDSCPRGFEPVGESKPLSFLIGNEAKAKELPSSSDQR